MAHIRCDFRSEVLDMNTSMTVILPEQIKLSSVKVVYLLHGLADNCSGWSRYTSVERYARKYNLALVIPEVQRSFYTDMNYGMKYFKFIHEELSTICMGFFGFSGKREDTYLMGLSMGGYGALKCALTTPESYAGCAMFSAITDIEKAVNQAKDGKSEEYHAIFGNSVAKEANPYSLLMQDHDYYPSFYVACGDDDIRLFHSEKIVSALTEKQISVKYENWSGDHNWDFWDEAVRRAFDYFFKEEERG